MTHVKAETRLAKVVHVADAGPVEVVINYGSLQGVKPGDKFLVIGPHLIDPDTGEDPGEPERVRGRGEAVHVQDQLATIRSLQRRQTRPARRIIRGTGRGPSIALFSLASGTSGQRCRGRADPGNRSAFRFCATWRFRQTDLKKS